MKLKKFVCGALAFLMALGTVNVLLAEDCTDDQAVITASADDDLKEFDVSLNTK